MGNQGMGGGMGGPGGPGGPNQGGPGGPNQGNMGNMGGGPGQNQPMVMYQVSRRLLLSFIHHLMSIFIYLHTSLIEMFIHVIMFWCEETQLRCFHHSKISSLILYEFRFTQRQYK